MTPSFPDPRVRFSSQPFPEHSRPCWQHSIPPHRHRLEPYAPQANCPTGAALRSPRASVLPFFLVTLFTLLPASQLLGVVMGFSHRTVVAMVLVAVGMHGMHMVRTHLMLVLHMDLMRRT